MSVPSCAGPWIRVDVVGSEKTACILLACRWAGAVCISNWSIRVSWAAVISEVRLLRAWWCALKEAMLTDVTVSVPSGLCHCLRDVVRLVMGPGLVASPDTWEGGGEWLKVWAALFVQHS